jgi:hypothetical protein
VNVVATNVRPDAAPSFDFGIAPGPRGAAIASIGISLPENVVGNAAIGSRLGVSDDWIERRTGIRSRRVAGVWERLDEHAARAARDALARTGIDPADVDLVLVATTTSDEMLPNTAPLVAHALGADRAGAFDIGDRLHRRPWQHLRGDSAACAGVRRARRGPAGRRPGADRRLRRRLHVGRSRARVGAGMSLALAPRSNARSGHIDELIAPSETRGRLAWALRSPQEST